MRRFFPAASALVLVAACQPVAIPLTQDDMASIRALGQAYALGNLAKDADAVAAVYSSDAVEMPPNEQARLGQAAIRDSYAQFFELGVEASEFTLTADEIDGNDGIAFDRGTWTWTGVPPGMTESVSDTGKYLGIVRRQVDGRWLWTSVIWNSDLPIPEPQ